VSRRADTSPIFVRREVAAELCDVSVDTFDQWVKDGFIPGPAIAKGQIRRWHWPTLEAKLAGEQGPTATESDPYIAAVHRHA
jgi:hypothetical protein